MFKFQPPTTSFMKGLIYSIQMAQCYIVIERLESATDITIFNNKEVSLQGFLEKRIWVLVVIVTIDSMDIGELLYLAVSQLLLLLLNIITN